LATYLAKIIFVEIFSMNVGVSTPKSQKWFDFEFISNNHNETTP